MSATLHLRRSMLTLACAAVGHRSPLRQVILVTIETLTPYDVNYGCTPVEPLGAVTFLR